MKKVLFAIVAGLVLSSMVVSAEEKAAAAAAPAAAAAEEVMAGKLAQDGDKMILQAGDKKTELKAADGVGGLLAAAVGKDVKVTIKDGKVTKVEVVEAAKADAKK